MQLSALTSALGRFVSDLQRRKVIRVGAGYAVVGWIVLQVALALQTAMKLPDSFSAAILALLVIGFPIALVLTWFFEITPEGIKRTLPATGNGVLVNPQTTDLILAGALCLVVLVALLQLLMPSPTGQSVTAPNATTAGASPPKPLPPVLGDKSIAVLPFKNLSPHKDDAYFADGLTEEVLNVFAQVRGLKVISRTSSATFRGKDTPLPDIARALGVRYVLEGSVRRDGEDVRVTAQLIDVPTDTHVWSKTFEPKLAHVFAVQDDIAQAIALALDLEIEASASPRRAPTQNIAAYRVWLEGLAASRWGNPESPAVLLDHSKRAVALDPNFAEALATLATAYTAQAFYDPAVRTTALPLAKQAAAAAVKLEPNGARVRTVLGGIALFELRWADAVRESSKALELDASITTSYLTLSATLWRAGKFKEASRLLNEGQSRDPLNRNFTISALLMAYDQGDDGVAEAIARRMTVATKNVSVIGHFYLAKIARDKGNREAAEEEFRAAMKARGTNNDIVEPVIGALRSKTSIGVAVRALRAEAAKDPTFEIAEFLALVDPSGWLDELAARVARGETLSVAWRIGGVWRLIAQGEGANPKVKALIRNVGLVDYWKEHGWPDRCRAKGEDDFECS